MTATMTILKFFKRYLLSNCNLDGAEIWREASEQHKNSDWLRPFCSDIQDGSHGGHIENLETTAASEW